MPFKKYQNRQPMKMEWLSDSVKKSKIMQKKYVAFLRGINVGGHHKVPMVELRKALEKLRFKNVITLLNSGNIIFEGADADVAGLEEKIGKHLEKVFGFPIPTLLRKAETIEDLLANDPFVGIEVTKAIRLYVSFLREETEGGLTIPWESEDGSYRILEKRGRTIISVLDISIGKTTKAMEILERSFGKGITTRNWNTLKRIEKKLETK